MSYLALARKWRPRRFEDVRGQGHVVTALSHALDRDQLHPAILLTGTRGVGKTTLARLIAKGLNCENGVTSKPCGVCSACQEVGEGRFVDLLEIDAASNTGVDNVRELIDNAQYSPARGRYKVYLIDEVHMLSKPAFNALLKTLEEPPPHVKFILATTDPQKLLATVLSRCLQFNLKRLPTSLLREAFADILKQEQIEADAGAVAEIAQAADGSMRDGLSLLDQAIAFAGGAPLTRALVEDMLGTVGRRTLFELLDALSRGNGEALLAGLRKLDESGPDYAALLNQLAALLQRIAVLQVLPQAVEADDDPALPVLAQTFTAEDVQVHYQIAVLGRRDLPYAPAPRLGFEMTLLRMFAFRPEVSATGAPVPGGGAGSTLKSASSVGSQLSASASVQSDIAKDASLAAPVVAREPAAKTYARSEGAASLKPAAPAQPRSSPPASSMQIAVEEKKAASPVPASIAAAVASSLAPSAAASVSIAAGGAADAAGDWSQRIDTLGLDGMTRQLARHCANLGESGGVARFALDARARHLLNDERRAALETALSRADKPVRVAIEIGVVEGQLSPAALEELRLIERQRNAERAIENDPAVRAMKEAFGATIRAGSIRPVD